MANKNIINKMPEENTEYTFNIYDEKKNKIVQRTYLFLGLNKRGRALLFNVNTRTTTDWSLGWFNKHLKRNFVCKRKSNIVIEVESTVAKKAPITKTAPLSLDEKHIINELRSMSPAMITSVLTDVQRHPGDIANDLERIFADTNEEFYTQEEVNTVCKQMIRALDIKRRLTSPNTLLTSPNALFNNIT